MPVDDWIEIAEAARILGVHASTLRRWADEGKIAHRRTLSGRRRFLRAELLKTKQVMQQGTPEPETLQFESKTIDLARQRTSHLADQQKSWFTHLSEEQRLLFRYSGQRMLGLMMQFVSRNGPAETFLEEGRRMAGDYGTICFRAGLSISQTAEAFLFFRRSIIESIQATSGLGGAYDPDSHRIFLRVTDFFDTLLVATIESYAQLSQAG